MVSTEQLKQLQSLAGQYGGADSQQFKDYVNTKLGTGGYDKLKSGLQDVKTAGGVDAYNTQQVTKTTTPTSTIATTTTPTNNTTYNPGTEPANTGPNVNTSNINNSTDAGKTVTDTIKSNINATNQQGTDYTNAMNTRTEEDKKISEERIKQTEETYKRYENMYKDYYNQTKALRDETAAIIEKRKTEDVDALNKQKQAELDKQQAANDLQKFNDEQAIKEAKTQQETANMQANWAFAKMGAGFSTAAVGTTQRIFTEGAVKIAGLKLQANYNQADMQNKLSTLEFNYTKEINRTIDTYTDKALTLKQDLINDITKLQNNLILNDKEKQTAINTAKDKFLENKRAYEDNMYKESEKLRDKALEQTKLLQEQMQLQEKNAIDKGSLAITSGDWARKTIQQQAEAEKQMGLPTGTLNAQMYSNINNILTTSIDKIMGSGYLLPNREQVVKDIITEMKNGRDLTTATTYVLERNLRNNPDYIEKQKQKALEGERNKFKTEAEIIALGYDKTINNVDINSIVDYSTKARGTDKLQCGQLVNDYWTQITGSKAGMGDDLQSKKNAISKIGVSDTPVVGGLFVSNPLNNNVGHTGIVQSYNNDGSITVLEANSTGSKDGGVPAVKTYTASEVSKMTFSKAPKGKEYNYTGQTTLKTPDLISYAAGKGYKLDTSTANQLSKLSGDKAKEAIDNLVETKKTKKNEDYYTTEDGIAEMGSNNDIKYLTNKISGVSTGTDIEIKDIPDIKQKILNLNAAYGEKAVLNYLQSTLQVPDNNWWNAYGSLLIDDGGNLILSVAGGDKTIFTFK